MEHSCVCVPSSVKITVPLMWLICTIGTVDYRMGGGNITCVLWYYHGLPNGGHLVTAWYGSICGTKGKRPAWYEIPCWSKLYKDCLTVGCYCRCNKWTVYSIGLPHMRTVVEKRRELCDVRLLSRRVIHPSCQSGTNDLSTYTTSFYTGILHSG